MNAVSCSNPVSNSYRQILGIRFFVGSAFEAVALGSQGGLVVAPAGPALTELAGDHEYRKALLESDVAITDSGFLVLLWNALKRDHLTRVSGLAYLKILLERAEFQESHAAVWVMPSEAAMRRNLAWLNSRGHPVTREDCYIAPNYSGGACQDETLADIINMRRPRHVIIGLGGGVQEKLGLYLKRQCEAHPAIHCIGAAIGFLSGDQVNIPDWADKMFLGWFFRCVSDPKKFVPRYAKALRLPLMLWRHSERLPA